MSFFWSKIKTFNKLWWVNNSRSPDTNTLYSFVHSVASVFQLFILSISLWLLLAFLFTKPPSRGVGYDSAGLELNIIHSKRPKAGGDSFTFLHPQFPISSLAPNKQKQFCILPFPQLFLPSIAMNSSHNITSTTISNPDFSCFLLLYSHF